MEPLSLQWVADRSATSNALSCRAQVLWLAPTKHLRHNPWPSWEGGVNRGPCGDGKVPTDPADGEAEGLPRDGGLNQGSYNHHAASICLS